MSVYIVEYAYGCNTKTCEPDIVSKLRTEAALQALRAYPDAKIVLGASLSEKTNDCGPLSDIIERLLLEKGIRSEQILRNPTGTNTLTETEAAHALIPKESTIICATSRFHARRVQLIWLARFGIWPKTFTSPLPARKKEHLYEWIKIPRDILRSLGHRVVQ